MSSTATVVLYFLLPASSERTDFVRKFEQESVENYVLANGYSAKKKKNVQRDTVIPQTVICANYIVPLGSNPRRDLCIVFLGKTHSASVV